MAGCEQWGSGARRWRVQQIAPPLPGSLTRALAVVALPPQTALGNLLLFGRLGSVTAQRIVSEMYEIPVAAGEILIQQGDSGAAATKLFVVKSGKFEVRGHVQDLCPQLPARAARGGFGRGSHDLRRVARMLRTCRRHLHSSSSTACCCADHGRRVGVCTARHRRRSVARMPLRCWSDAKM